PGVQRTRLDYRRRCDWWGCGRNVAGPDQDSAVLVHGHTLRLDDFVFQILQAGIVEVELPLGGVIRPAFPLAPQLQDLMQHGIKVHGRRPPRTTGRRYGEPWWTMIHCRPCEGN